MSFRLDAGRTLGIVGESGSGKTVLTRGITGLLPPTRLEERGSVVFAGRPLSWADREALWGRHVGLVPQDPMTSLNPVMRVGRQVAEPLRLHLGLDRRAARRRAAELLAAVGLPDSARHLRRYPHQLSGGMRQRVMIAMAVAAEPDLLVADEPTTAVDVTLQRQILDLLATMQSARGMAMVLVTHDLEVARARTDDVIVMYGGRVMEAAPAAQLFTTTRHPYTEALLHAVPARRSGTRRLVPIPGMPPDPVSPPPGCRFAPRCRYAQNRCVEETPWPDQPSEHRYACFFPVGTEAGAEALARNLRAGTTAAGLAVPVTGA